MAGRSLDELAMQFAMLTPANYASGSFAGDSLEHQADALKQEMGIRFGEFAALKAVEAAYETLAMMDYHPEPKG
jgi:hypothetical protein